MASAAIRSTLLRLVRGLPSDGSADDAALLARFSAGRDEAAFELLLLRHGAMVRGVCRRVLRHEQDAEDAFQATFLALARSAGGVGRGSLAGWLYRVAYHVALKAKARSARRQETAEPAEIAGRGDPVESVQDAELRTVLGEEVARLPDRFRQPVVLCYFEGKSNSEVATELGCPRGTVDSRLATARQRLARRLVRRGLAPAAAAAAVERLLGTGAVVALAPSLVHTTARAALAFLSSQSVADGSISPAAAALAQGVLQMMFVTKLKWATVALLAIGLLGTGGATGLQALAGGQDATKDKPPATTKAAPLATSTAEVRTEAPTDRRRGYTASAVRQLLKRPVGVDKAIENAPLRDVLAFLSDNFNVTIRLDPAAFARYQLNNPSQLLEQQVRVEAAPDMTMAGILREVLAQVRDPEQSGAITFLVKGSQIAIVPAYRTPYARLGGDAEPQTLLPPELIEEQVLGEPVTVDYQNLPLNDVVRDLVDMTGANIVIDTSRLKGDAAPKITVNLQQVRLFKALQVIADMAGLQPVALDNVYYLTTPENAERLEKKQFPKAEAAAPKGA